MKIQHKILVLGLVGVFLMTSCKQKDVHTATEPITKTESKDAVYDVAKPILTKEQKDMLRTIEEKIADLSPQDKERYESFKKEIKMAKTGSELNEVISKYKDLTKKVR